MLAQQRIKLQPLSANKLKSFGKQAQKFYRLNWHNWQACAVELARMKKLAIVRHRSTSAAFDIRRTEYVVELKNSIDSMNFNRHNWQSCAVQLTRMKNLLGPAKTRDIPRSGGIENRFLLEDRLFFALT